MYLKGVDNSVCNKNNCIINILASCIIVNHGEWANVISADRVNLPRVFNRVH